RRDGGRQADRAACAALWPAPARLRCTGHRGHLLRRPPDRRQPRLTLKQAKATTPSRAGARSERAADRLPCPWLVTIAATASTARITVTTPGAAATCRPNPNPNPPASRYRRASRRRTG